MTTKHINTQPSKINYGSISEMLGRALAFKDETAKAEEPTAFTGICPDCNTDTLLLSPKGKTCGCMKCYGGWRWPSMARLPMPTQDIFPSL